MASRKIKKSVASRKSKRSKRSRRARKTIKHLNRVGGGGKNSRPPPPSPPPPPTPPLALEPTELLINAVREGNLAETIAALERGDNSNAMDENGVTLLMMATIDRRIDIIRELLVSGYTEVDHPLPEYSDWAGGDTPLIIASKLGFAEIVELLMKNFANVNAKNEAGESAIWWAAHNGDADVMIRLMDDYKNENEHKFIKLDTKTRGTTPIEIATAKLDEAVIKKTAQTDDTGDTENYDTVIARYETVIDELEEEEEYQTRMRCQICDNRSRKSYQYKCEGCKNLLCYNCLSEICKARTVEVANHFEGEIFVHHAPLNVGRCPYCRKEIPAEVCDNVSTWLAANPQPDIPDDASSARDSSSSRSSQSSSDSSGDSSSGGGGGKRTKTRSHRNKKRKSRHSKKRGRKSRC
jgi:uncharacterized membrane protein YgcG